MNNIKDDRALTETPAHYPLLGAWPSSQPDSGSWLGGLWVGGGRRGEPRSGAVYGVDLAEWPQAGGSGVLPLGLHRAVPLPFPGLWLPI